MSFEVFDAGDKPCRHKFSVWCKLPRCQLCFESLAIWYLEGPAGCVGPVSGMFPDRMEGQK